ncbi:MAG: hypothetical protein GX053_03545 [Tissierella sp.]|nr:hypothetical protein [Tissierella sp.]
MNWLEIFAIAFGIFYLIYSIKFRNRPTVYFRDTKIVKGKEAKYLKIQLYLSILIALIFIAVGITVAKNDLDGIYIILTPLILHFINFMIKIISRIKGYVE